MDSLISYVAQPWHWAVSGTAIALILFLMTWLGKSFGVSTTFKGMCTLAGAGKRHDFFDEDIKNHYWRFAFVGGAILGGFIAANFLQSSEPVAIAETTVSHLQDWGIPYPADSANGFLPTGLFNFYHPKGVILAMIGGFLVGFGARYAGGCTSGHAITGLSHLQLPSLVTVIGFFIGGLTMTWIIMPMLF